MVTEEAVEINNLVRVPLSRFNDSTTEKKLRLVGNNSRAIVASNERIAQSEERIEQILEYLFRERPVLMVEEEENDFCKIL